MPSPIQQKPIQKPTGCKLNDVTSPPTPSIQQSFATAGVAKEGAAWSTSTPGRAPAARRDPGYIEIGNWEPGTRIQLINVSHKPNSDFDCKDDVITLDPTGMDAANRQASVWLTDAQMQKMNFASGHQYRLRLIDADGNVSDSVPGRLEGSNYGQRGQIRESNTWEPGSQVQVLDAAERKTRLMKHIPDTTPPEVQAFRDELRLESAKNGAVTLASDVTLEPGCTVRVQNGRTGAVSNGSSGDDRSIKLPIKGGAADGDTLTITVTDRDGNEAQSFDVRYGSKCKDGKAKSLGILDVQASLKPVIP